MLVTGKGRGVRERGEEGKDKKEEEEGEEGEEEEEREEEEGKRREGDRRTLYSRNLLKHTYIGNVPFSWSCKQDQPAPV